MTRAPSAAEEAAASAQEAQPRAGAEAPRPQLRLERWPVERLREDPENARRHGARNLDAVEASLVRFGQQAPLVVQEDGVVLAGNARLRVLRERGEAFVDVVVTTLRGPEARAFAIADNRTAELAEWDENVLLAALDALPDELHAAAGWLPNELDVLASGLSANLPVDEDDISGIVERADELLKQWGVERGQVWLLGEHRIMCGDSTNADDVARLLDGVRPLLMVTDPPYGVSYDATWRPGLLGSPRRGLIVSDDRADWREAWALFPGDVAYVWHAGQYAGIVSDSLAAAGFLIRSQIIWNKSVAPMGRGDYHWKHEPCWYAVRKGATAKFIGERTNTTVWDLSSPIQMSAGSEESTPHPTQKPLETSAKPLRNHAAPEVYDPFLGSGTTLIAAESLQRRCFGMDIEPKYLAIALQRWADRTGRTPTLAPASEPA